jgi:TP901 family phage tail tape measure protein
MGLTIDDTVGLLSAFANAGILGAEAGTQMRSMFIQLQKPTAQAQETSTSTGSPSTTRRGSSSASRSSPGNCTTSSAA